MLAAIKKDFACGFSDDQAIETSIREVYQKDHYLMDPHTASGYKVMRITQAKDPHTPMVLLSTASPYKFVNAVSDAILGHHASSPIQTTKAIQKATKIIIPHNLAQVWQLPTAPNPVIKPAEMPSFVAKKVKEVFQND